MKIGIGGIKFSEELVHVTHNILFPSDRSFIDLIERIAEKRINMPFVCAGAIGGETVGTFCIAATDFVFLEKLLDSHPPLIDPACRQPSVGLSLRNQLQIRHGVGTLTVFPHRRSLAMVGEIIKMLGQAGIVIYSLCTSISAVAINICYKSLDPAVLVLGKKLELPDNHAPFRPEFSVTQVSLDPQGQ